MEKSPKKAILARAIGENPKKSDFGTDNKRILYTGGPTPYYIKQTNNILLFYLLSLSNYYIHFIILYIYFYYYF